MASEQLLWPHPKEGDAGAPCQPPSISPQPPVAEAPTACRRLTCDCAASNVRLSGAGSPQPRQTALRMCTSTPPRPYSVAVLRKTPDPLWCVYPQGGATTTGPDATPPQLSVKTCGGGVGRRMGGGYWQLGRGGGGCAQPTTITCIPQGGVWGHGGIEVCMR